MTNRELAMMHLAQATLYLHKAELPESKAKVQQLIREIAARPCMPTPEEIFHAV